MSDQIEITRPSDPNSNEKFDVKAEIAKEVKEFEEKYREKSFSERNPALGKMINCQFCDRRHRSVIQCEQKFALDENEAPRTGANIPGQYPHQTRRGALGVMDNTKGKRVLPHHSHKLLQLVQLTQDMFPAEQPFWPTPVEAMRRARTLAGRILRKKARLIANLRRRRQHVSRAINRGLAVSGSR
jgi:hypothetical protein